MPALFFPNLNALRLALTSGLVPAAVGRSPAAAGFDGHGRLWLEPTELPPRDSLAALARLGVQTLGVCGVPTHPVISWAELLQLVPDPKPTAGRILFLVPERRLPGFAARLRRGSSGPVGVSLPEGGPQGLGWATALAPRAFLLAEAAEPGSQADAFAEQSPGVWVRHGWRHPLPEQLPVPPDRVLLVRPPDSVVAVACDAPPQDADEFLLRAVRVPTTGPTPRASVAVRLSLGPVRSPEKETLWVLGGESEREFWASCAAADERLVRRLEAASVGNGDESRLIVRVVGKRPTPFIALPPGGFAADSRLPGLFVPADRVLRPRLRERELAAALGVAKHRVVWVEPTPDGGIVTHALPVSAFRPVAELLDYRAPEAAPLEVAPRVDPFPLTKFVVVSDPVPVEEIELELEFDPRPERDPPRRESVYAPAEPGWFARSIRKLLARLRPVPERDAPSEAQAEQPQAAPPGPARAGERQLDSPDVLLHGRDWPARKRELEGRLFRELPRLDPAGRAARWADLAGIYSATGNAGDAAVCWMNASWESPEPVPAWLGNWLAAECRAARLGDGGLDRWLSEPGRPGVGRVVAAYVAAAGFAPAPPPEFLPTLPRLLAFLDQHFDDLPVRAAWLARLAAARACDGDALGLARWRDRVLARLADRGPALDLDEPSFLRFHGTASAERFQAARDWLSRVHQPALAWVRSQGGGKLQFAGLDPETTCTAAYAQFMFAWGLGCLGERAKSRDLAAKARKVVGAAGGPRVDPAAHAVLGDLFLLRVRDAQEGRAAKPDLPPELQARVDALSDASLARFAVGRLRDRCRILEPLPRARAFGGLDLKSFWGNDRLGERLSVLAGRDGRERFAEEADELLRVCAADPTTATVPRVVLTLLDLAPGLPPHALLRVLDLLPTAVDWLEPLLAAQPWRPDEVGKKLTDFSARMIGAAFAAVATRSGDVVAPAVAELVRRLLAGPGVVRAAMLRTAGAVFRALRRFGLRGEAESVVRFLEPGAAGGPLAERVGLACGWFVAGDDEAGDRVLVEAREVLYLAHARPADRTELALAYADALGFAPTRIAHGRLEEIFQRLATVERLGSTNLYFTLRPLQLIDAVVRAVVTDEFTLGPSVRGWLDDDEFLIRGRIHRDLAAVLRDRNLD